jgi:hypothetical protein
MERPILFSTDMVCAILEGRKTQTRRICKDKTLQSWIDAGFNDSFLLDSDNIEAYKKRFHLGDILWVKETFCNKGVNSTLYKAKLDEDLLRGFEEFKMKWQPSRFMPKLYSRIKLHVKNVRIERLNDISENDAIAEGIDELLPFGEDRFENYGRIINESCLTAIESYKSLWEKINGEDSWSLNPFVWVIDFEVSSLLMS